MSKAQSEKEYWTFTYSFGALRIYAWERLERGGRIFVKFLDPRKRGRDRRAKAKLAGDLTVRDHRGSVDKKKLREVDEAVAVLAARLMLGQHTKDTPVARGALTLTDGFSAALDTDSGKYPAKTRRWDEVKRAQAKLERILGRDTLWIDIKPGDVRRVWRTLADEAKRSKPAARVCGARQTEVTIDALYSVAAWLREEGQLPPDAALPMPKWRAKLRSEWPTRAGADVTVARPRHSREEMHRLFAVVHDPRVDPRFALAFDLGGEQRMGQVLRCWRSHLELTPVSVGMGGTLQPGQLGLVRVPGVGKKTAAPVVLTAEQRVAVDSAFSGYLADYEAAWRAGKIEDYPLFPAGRFKKGKAKVVPSPKPLTRDAARKAFHRLETVANVTSIKGRGWYGVRRIATDLAEDVESDERVLNSITGHRDSTTRRLVYQDQERPEVLNRAAITRAKVRRGMVKEPKGAKDSAPLFEVVSRTA
jgi:hypothetical protein